MDKDRDPSAQEGTRIPESASEGQVVETIREVRRLLEDGDHQAALALFGRFHPVDQGTVLMGLAHDPQLKILTELTPGATAEILEIIEPEEAAEVTQRLGVTALSQILDEASPDVAADILRLLPRERSQATLAAMQAAPEVVPLMGYPDDTAGGIMTPGYPVVRDGTTTGNALDQLRLLGAATDNLSSVLVVDQNSTLVGSLSVTRLALARPNTVVGEIANPDFISAHVDTDQEECARLMERYDLSHLPVVDGQSRLVGVILSEDLVDVVEEEATEDMYRMASMAGERVFGPLRNSFRRRLPWLYINLATAFLAAGVVSLFEETIKQVVALAVFLPVVAGQGGIGGTQTVTLVVRSMALGELPGGLGRRLLVREVVLGVIHGALLGVVVGIMAYAWKGNYMMGIVLGIAMLGNMVVAAIAGAGVPLLLRRLRMDPAVSSAVFVTTFTDVIGFLMFLGLAASLIKFLV